MNDTSDLIGLLGGLFLIALLGFFAGQSHGERIARDKACGGCEVGARGDQCGDFTCTAEGWR